MIALAAAAGVPPALAADQSSSEVRPSALEEGDFEHTIVLGLGGAAEVELGSGSWHPGVNAFIEFEAIPNWLELELGVSVLHTLERPGALRRPVAQEAVQLLIAWEPRAESSSASDKLLNDRRSSVRWSADGCSTVGTVLPEIIVLRHWRNGDMFDAGRRNKHDDLEH